MATRERERTTGTERSRTAAPDHQLPPGRGAGSAGRGSDRTGIIELLRRLADDTSALLRQEIRLAKMEAAHTAKRVAADSGWIAAGAAVAAVGGICLVVAMALALGDLLDSYWLGTLITGLLLVLIGGLGAWKGIRDLRKGAFTPDRTISTLREDADWAKAELRDFKDQLRE